MNSQSNIVAGLAGMLFGFGLGVANMIDPNKVQNFLDIGGAWDPSLMFVLGGAVLVSLVAHRLIMRRHAPILVEKFFLPTTQIIDRRLLIGAGIFGIGWGLAGYCPGPGFAALSLASWEPFVFVATMLLGFALHRVAIKE